MGCQPSDPAQALLRTDDVRGLMGEGGGAVDEPEGDREDADDTRGSLFLRWVVAPFGGLVLLLAMFTGFLDSLWVGHAVMGWVLFLGVSFAVFLLVYVFCWMPETRRVAEYQSLGSSSSNRSNRFPRIWFSELLLITYAAVLWADLFPSFPPAFLDFFVLESVNRLPYGLTSLAGLYFAGFAVLIVVKSRDGIDRHAFWSKVQASFGPKSGSRVSKGLQIVLSIWTGFVSLMVLGVIRVGSFLYVLELILLAGTLAAGFYVWRVHKKDVVTDQGDRELGELVDLYDKLDRFGSPVFVGLSFLWITGILLHSGQIVLAVVDGIFDPSDLLFFVLLLVSHIGGTGAALASHTLIGYGLLTSRQRSKTQRQAEVRDVQRRYREFCTRVINQAEGQTIAGLAHGYVEAYGLTTERLPWFKRLASEQLEGADDAGSLERELYQEIRRRLRDGQVLHYVDRFLEREPDLRERVASDEVADSSSDSPTDELLSKLGKLLEEHGAPFRSREDLEWFLAHHRNERRYEELQEAVAGEDHPTPESVVHSVLDAYGESWRRYRGPMNRLMREEGYDVEPGRIEDLVEQELERRELTTFEEQLLSEEAEDVDNTPQGSATGRGGGPETE